MVTGMFPNLVSMLIRLPLPQCFCSRGRKLRPWSEKNSDQNSDHPRLCNYWGNEKLRPWSEFLGRENSDHGLSFGCFWGRGRRGGSHSYSRKEEALKKSESLAWHHDGPSENEKFSNSLMGSLAKGIFRKVLRKFCGNLAELSQNCGLPFELLGLHFTILFWGN